MHFDLYVSSKHQHRNSTFRPANSLSELVHASTERPELLLGCLSWRFYHNQRTVFDDMCLTAQVE
jgi:hypothetical protein